MQGFLVRDILPASASPTPGKHASDSNRFPGHEARMQSHIHRIETHQCEQPEGHKCLGCIKRKRPC